MNKKPCGLFFLLFLCVPFYTFASSVSVFMCQNDSAVETLRETTFILESGYRHNLDSGRRRRGNRRCI